MAAFIFSGDPRAPGTDPDKCILFGKEFPLNVPVTVDNPEVAARLRRHSHFTEAKDEPAEAPVEVVKPRRGRPPKAAAVEGDA